MTLEEIVAEWFETGDYPTEEQFAFWRQSIWWKDQKLSITDIEGLPDILNANLGGSGVQLYTVGPDWNNRYTIPAGFRIEDITIIPVEPNVPYLSDVYEGYEPGNLIAADDENPVGPEGVIWEKKFYAAIERIIEIGGVTEGCRVAFIKRKMI